MVKQSIIWISACLILAIAVNGAVAVACAMAAQQWPRSPVDVLTSHGYVATRAIAREHYPDRNPTPIPMAGGDTKSFGYDEVMIVCSIRAADESMADATVATIVRIQSGWPWRSFRYSTTSTTDTNSWSAQFAFSRSRRMTSQESESFLLPLTPIWKGFLYNSLVYFAILVALLLVPWLVRRWIRLKRGLCPRCAYPIGVSDRCTECGAPLPARRRRSVVTGSLPRDS